MDCLFCEIIKKNINSDIVFEDDDVLAFKDIFPQAPVHILIIPKKHFSTINDVSSNDQELLGKLMITAQKIAQNLGIHEEGYRLVMNCNENGGQTVFHVHLHLLGGQKLSGSMVG